jgi:hypothetical protein
MKPPVKSIKNIQVFIVFEPKFNTYYPSKMPISFHISSRFNYFTTNNINPPPFEYTLIKKIIIINLQQQKGS